MFLMTQDVAEGARVWLIPDGFIPDTSLGSIDSHETISFLNTSANDAQVRITFYFSDREPIKDVRVTVPAERTRHIRTGNAEVLGGAAVPAGVPYAVRIESDIPISVQHSRLDGRQEALGLMTTIAYPLGR
jgi:hypothetical protein